MSKESWFSAIPFLNKYPIWAQLVLLGCIIIFICVLIFAYPKLLEKVVLFAKKIFTSLWTLIGIISVILAFTYFYPKVSVSPSSSLNPQNAFLTPFVISNDGNISVKNVEFLFKALNIQLASGGRVIGGVGFKEVNNLPPIMRASEKYTVIFPSQVNFGIITSADMVIVVRFKLPFLPFKTWERFFRFTTARDIDGKLNWYPQPLGK